jgi:hypothetical protein
MADYDALLDEFRERRLASRHQTQYREGQKLNQVLAHVQMEREKQRKDDLQREALSAFESDRSAVLKRQEEFDAQTKSQLRELQDRLAEERIKLQKEQTREFDEHDEHWASERKGRQYRNASVQLLVHRRQLDLLLERSEFADAEQVAAIIKRLELEKQEEMTALRQHEYDETVKLLIARHESELQAFEARAAVQTAHFLQKRQRKRLALENCEKKVKTKGQTAGNKERIWAIEQTRLAAQLSRDARLSRQSSKGGARPAPIVSRIQKDAVIPVPRETIIPLPPLVTARRQKRMQSVE